MTNSFTDCKSLHEIHFDEWPHLNNLPNDIDKLQSLKIINISEKYFVDEVEDGNYIKELPASIGNLRNLEELNLFGCKNIKKLPKSFKNITTLKSLNINNSGIKKLQLTDQQWHNLESFATHDENTDFTKCANLKKLTWESHTGTEAINSSISSLSKLESLRILGGRMPNVDFIQDLANLRKMYLSCHVDNLPECLGEMEFLEEIYIHGNKQLTSLPVSLAKSKSLKKIILKYTGILDIPRFLKEREDIDIVFHNGETSFTIMDK